MATWDQTELLAAQTAQKNAANDTSQVVRLVAGPGTGKSFSIEQKIANLLQSGVQAGNIYAVSYTRAAAKDLKLRIEFYCQKQNLLTGTGISTSTLHSLALRLLRTAGVLDTQFPAGPMVLDNWEVKNIFDEEFRHINKLEKKRTADIRGYYEAFWSTGNKAHPSYNPPQNAITQEEQNQFDRFKKPRSTLYSCVLPGEIVQLVVQRATTGTLNPQQLLGISHLIVDEFQDLNPMDLNFIDILTGSGIRLFASGDDDQSIYSFRFGSPNGIRQLPNTYQGCGTHNLAHCFRCTPEVLNSATSLMNSYGDPQRLPKNYVSMYSNSNPNVQGHSFRWIFDTHRAEGKAIASSCESLINAGLPPNDILILVSNKGLQLNTIEQELQKKNIDFESPNQQSLQDTKDGRWIISLLRLINNNDDYVALRTLWSERSGVGMVKTIELADWITNNQQNFKNVFFQNLTLTGLQTPTVKLVNDLRKIITYISGWTSTDLLSTRLTDISTLLTNHAGLTASNVWESAISTLDPSTTLKEVRDFLWADNDEQRQKITEAINDRLQVDNQNVATNTPKVRIMTMHGSKGLSGKVVFIPGLEEQVLPGPNRVGYPGQLQEAARLLYVAITRAKACCILSFAKKRSVHGRMKGHVASQFTNALGGTFQQRTNGLDPTETAQVMTAIGNL